MNRRLPSFDMSQPLMDKSMRLFRWYFCQLVGRSDLLSCWLEWYFCSGESTISAAHGKSIRSMLVGTLVSILSE